MSDSEIEQAWDIECSAIIPEKSKLRYEKTYRIYKNWCEDKRKSSNEKVLLAYLVRRNEKLKSLGGLWAEYSMLKSTTFPNSSVDILKFTALIAFLKRKTVGHRPKKSSDLLTVLERVRNPSSEIFNVMSTSNPCSPQSCTPNRNRSSDSFNRLFGNAEPGTPRRSSISKHETSPRNPVTGDGVISWDSKNSNRHTPRPLRNPVTGESYTIQKSPVSTPKKSLQNGYQKQNGHSNGLSNGHSNGLQNGHSDHHHESPMINGKA